MLPACANVIFTVANVPRVNPAPMISSSGLAVSPKLADSPGGIVTVSPETVTSAPVATAGAVSVVVAAGATTVAKFPFAETLTS